MNAVATLPAPPTMKSSQESNFELALREANALASSTLVPKSYQGKANIPNVLIASEIAKRIGASTLLVMQNLHIIQGKPSWSSTFLIACVNACGRFTPMRFEVVGNNPKDNNYRVRAYAEDKASGERCNGPWVDWEMVKAEGWLSKGGSKWKTMPELMFMYRSAGFWSRLFAPEVSMGILTREEVEDVWGGGGAAVSVAAPTDTSSLGTLEAELTGRVIDTETGEILDAESASFEDVQFAIRNAASIQELDAAAALIESLPEGDAAELDEEHRARRVALTSE